MAININIPKPVIDYNDLDNKPTLVTDHSQLNLDDGTNPHGTTASDVGAVPYTGATTDVDLGNNDLNAEGVKIKGTAGNGHLNMKHQSSNPTAGGQETVIFAGSDGEPRFKNDGNAIEQFASREWVNLQWFQTTPIVVNANITAQNDTVYHVVANATFTDPTPVEGRGYVVLLRNGVVTIGGVSNGNLGTVFYRIYRGTSWITYIHYDLTTLQSIFVPKTRTINGLDLTVDRTLTTANINDSTNKRYVTDAQLTVIGNTTGTNTGDQDLSGLMVKTNNLSDLTNATTARTNLGLGTLATQSGTFSGTSSGTNTGDETASSILTKLGWVRRLQKGGTVTGTTAETIVHTFSFTANEYPSSSILHIESQFIRTGTPVNNGTIRVRINTSNTLVGSTQISTQGMGGNTNVFCQFRRKFNIQSGLVEGFPSGSSVVSDLITSATAPLSASLDTTQDWWLFVTYHPNNSGDTAIVNFSEVKNF